MNIGEPRILSDPLFREGLDWLSRMRSDAVTVEESVAFEEWRALSADHRQAYARAEAFGATLKTIGRSVLAQVEMPHRVRSLSGRTVGRRALLTGAVAASAAAVMFGARQIELVPDFLGPAHDFATGTGEQRTVRLASGLDVALDARTRIAVATANGGHRVDLLQGRAAVTVGLADGSVELVAGAGRATASHARFDVRLDGGEGCVTCMAGTVRVDHPRGMRALVAGQQVRYDADRLNVAHTVNVADADAWRSGKLIFRRTPLAEVIREVNRYRKGEIILANRSVASRPINGVFDVLHLESAIVQVEQVSGTSATHLPGGIVILA